MISSLFFKTKPWFLKTQKHFSIINFFVTQDFTRLAPNKTHFQICFSCFLSCPDFISLKNDLCTTRDKVKSGLLLKASGNSSRLQTRPASLLNPFPCICYLANTKLRHQQGHMNQPLLFKKGDKTDFSSQAKLKPGLLLSPCFWYFFLSNKIDDIPPPPSPTFLELLKLSWYCFNNL